MLVNVMYWKYNCKNWKGSMCNLTKQAFAKVVITLKLSSCIREIHCSTIKQILQNKCVRIRFVSTNKNRSYNSAFMRLLMNVISCLQIITSPMEKHCSCCDLAMCFISNHWDVIGLAEDRNITLILWKTNTET